MLKALKEKDRHLNCIFRSRMDGLKTFREIITIHPGQRTVIASGLAVNNELMRQ
ncbi:MAG: hypothetical protein NTU74_02830 [Deltaproteobacteria bacterium]|nr:hypothetical protein [Deltaproteobacteria bacterium]